MPKKDSSPDWFARGAAALGIILSLTGLVLTYYNNRWQKEVYQENIAERVLVRLSAYRTFNHVEAFPRDPKFSFDPKGEIGMEIVNIGLRPLYLKKAGIRIDTGNIRIFSFYEHDPAKPEPMKLLEPSEAANYRISWDFAEHPLMVEWQSDWTKPLFPMTTFPPKRDDIEVQVETSKKSFFFEHQTVNQISIRQD